MGVREICRIGSCLVGIKCWAARRGSCLLCVSEVESEGRCRGQGRASERIDDETSSPTRDSTSRRRGCARSTVKDFSRLVAGRAGTGTLDRLALTLSSPLAATTVHAPSPS